MEPEEQKKTEADKARGERLACFFSLIVSMMFGLHFWSYQSRGERMPDHLYVFYAPLIGIGLGVSINPESIGKSLGRRD